MTPKLPSFAVIPASRRFAADEEEAFASQLQRGTVKPLIVRSPQDLFLTSEGVTSGGFRFTTLALFQISRALSPGLPRLLFDIAGINESDVDDPQDNQCDVTLSSRVCYSAEVASKLFNDVLRFRFSRVRGYGLVIDATARVIEGVVGRSYGPFSTYEMYGRAKDWAARHSADLEFHDAVVYGRDVLFRLRERKHCFALQTPTGKREPFYAGWHFANSEVGRGSARVAAAVIRRWTGLPALVFPQCRPARHSRGVLFGERLEKQFEELPELLVSIRGLGARMQELARTPLVKTTDLAEAIRRTSGRLHNTQLRLAHRLAIARKALAGCSYKSTVAEELPQVTTKGRVSGVDVPALAERTFFDLYNAMLEHGRESGLRAEELCGQHAYRLLTSNFFTL